MLLLWDFQDRQYLVVRSLEEGQKGSLFLDRGLLWYHLGSIRHVTYDLSHPSRFCLPCKAQARAPFSFPTHCEALTQNTEGGCCGRLLDPRSQLRS